MKTDNTTDNQNTQVEDWMQEIWDWADTNNVPNSMIPRDPESLPHIKTLDIFFGQSITYKEGVRKVERSAFSTLPKAIVNLKKLKYLRLVGVDTKHLPTNFDQLDSLQTLVFLHPSFAELPESVCDLKNLKSLNIFSRQLQKLPDNFGNLSALESFDMRGTKVQHLPESIGNLHRLQSIELYSNDLRSLPESLIGLRNLEQFKIAGSSHLQLSEDMQQLLKGLGGELTPPKS